MHVGAVEPGGLDRDEHLPGARLGVRALLDDQLLITDDDGAHEAREAYLSSTATHSMCGVCGNMSTGRTRVSAYPASTSCAAFGASVVGLQETYTIRFADASISRRTTFWLRPARGGSTTITSGRPGLLDELPERQPDVAGVEMRVVDLVEARVGDRVGDRVLDQLESPHLSGPRRHQQPDRSDPAEQVVDALVSHAARRNSIASRVELLGHLGIRLKERVRRDVKAHPAELLLEAIGAGQQLVSPPCVTSATESICDHSTASALLAAASASVSSLVGLVTSRT